MSERSIARPLKLPRGIQVIGVGSAVLGGAGKTPVAIALARELARRGAKVALISHAYRASPERAREVRPDDHPGVVGDDALASARALEGEQAPVIVAPDRASALERASAIRAEIAIIDGLLQASPERVACSILVLDEASPWGSRRCPPLGDLRAPRRALLAAADHTVVVTDTITGATTGDSSNSPHAESIPKGALRLISSINNELDALRHLNLGLLVAIARPERIVRALARRGINPTTIIALADHASFQSARSTQFPRVDAWLTTPRCATKLGAPFAGADVLVLDHRIDVSPLIPLVSAILRPRSAASRSPIA